MTNRWALVVPHLQPLGGAGVRALAGAWRAGQRAATRASFTGTIKAGQRLARMTTDGRILPESAKYLYTFQGLNKIEIEEASAGDIISLAGLEGIGIGETLADPANPVALPTIKVE